MKNKTVAIEIKKGSETFNLFSQIYPTFFCPCLVFIQNGRLVFFLNAEASKEKVIESIEKYSDMEQANSTPNLNNNANVNTNANTNTSANPSSNPSLNSSSATSPVAQPNLTEKDKINEEKKKERNEELKQKKREKASRRKEILEQINNDRKERESRNKSNSSSRDNSSENIQKLLNEKPKSTSNSNDALISVRYLDGTLFRQEFKRTQKLSDVRKWIDDNAKAKGIFKPYNLETKYPEHQFTFGEETKSLIDLNLDDTDLLICKPVTKVFSSNPRQSLQVGKFFSENFFKDLFLFFYAFILSFNIFRDPMAPKEEGAEEGQGSNQTVNYKKGKIRMNNER